MKKRFLAFLMALSLAVCPSVFASEDQAAQETGALTEPEAPAEENTEQISRLEEALKAITDEDLNEYARKLMEMDKLEALENALIIKQTLESEEFARLMEYPEMKELAKEVVNKTGDFIMEEPELAGKILITLGMDEKIVNVLVALFKE